MRTTTHYRLKDLLDSRARRYEGAEKVYEACELPLGVAVGLLVAAVLWAYFG